MPFPYHLIPDTGRPALLPSIQKDFKSPCLQSVLQGKPSPTKQPVEEPDGQPPAKRKKIDLIFKDVLEASLEDSTKSKTQCSVGSRVDSSDGSLNVSHLKVEEKEEEKPCGEEPSTSFCPNCVKLKRRILELEEELSRLRGEPRDGPPMSEQALPQNDQATPHPEQGPIEDFQGEQHTTSFILTAKVMVLLEDISSHVTSSVRTTRCDTPLIISLLSGTKCCTSRATDD